jgi:hypothetical protein
MTCVKLSVPELVEQMRRRRKKSRRQEEEEDRGNTKRSRMAKKHRVALTAPTSP